jgi:hypothetical protein
VPALPSARPPDESAVRRHQDARLGRDNEAIRAAIHRYDAALERYIPGGGG